LLNEVIDAFHRSGRRLVTISVSVLPSGRAGVTWWYGLDVSRSPALSPLPPLARPATAMPRSPSNRTPPPADPARPAMPARETPVDRAPRNDPDRHWDRLLAVLTSRLGTAWLQPPARESDLARLTAAFGHPLPAALRAGYLRHNGQADTDLVGRFFGLRWLSIDEILARTAFKPADRGSPIGRNGPASGVELDPDRAGDPAAIEAEDHSSTPPHAVQLRFAHPGWLPVFDRVLSSYSFLAVDMAPGPAGNTGQIINFGEYERDHVVIARDFHALLAWMDAEATADHLAFHDDDEHDHVTAACHLVHTDDRNVDLITLLADRCGRHTSAR
jgi:cell wall assembly regulator SMI1